MFAGFVVSICLLLDSIQIGIKYVHNKSQVKLLNFLTMKVSLSHIRVGFWKCTGLLDPDFENFSKNLFFR